MLLTALLLAAAAAASPAPERRFQPPGGTLMLLRPFNTTGGFHALVQSDLARVHAYLGAHQAAGAAPKAGAAQLAAAVPLSNIGALLTAEVRVGGAPDAYTLIVDTGSANTFVGARPGRPYAPSPAGAPTGQRVHVEYGSGAFSGDEFTDTVALGDAAVAAQSVGAATSASGFGDFDGILGLGPAELTRGTLSDPDATIPTVVDNLAQQGTIPHALIGLAIPPTSAPDAPPSTLDLGAPDPAKYTAPLAFAPRTAREAAASFWGIEQSVSYGSAPGTPILQGAAGIVDSGTTLLFLASDAFAAYAAATGAVPDPATTLLRVESAERLQSLFFSIGGTTLELTPNAQIWPRALNTAMGGDAGATYLIVASTGAPSGSGVDFINGFSFLERFYSVYDTENGQVGFAPTAYTNATTN